MSQLIFPGISINVGMVCYKCHSPERRSKGLCLSCGREYRRNWRERNLHKDRAIRRVSKVVRRRRALSKLGGKCVCCGEFRYTMLHFDHIHNDGYKLKKKARSYHVEQEIIRSANPGEKFQVLCANCNMSKHINRGSCEHKTEFR